MFIEFLKRLLANAPTPVFLIVNGHPTHKAKAVKRFVEEQDGALECGTISRTRPWGER